MQRIKIINIVGARPNFMKIAPLMREYKKYSKIKSILVHTGQHYDQKMSAVFFKSLKIKKSDYNLEVGSDSHAKQTAKIMERLEPIFAKEKPDLVLVVGDVNSTIAAALTAVKMNIKVAHVEAGLRSFDRTMPEEINRLLTDHLSDFLFVTEKSGLINLKKEGIPKEKIYFVGNVMIDTLIANLPQINRSKITRKLKLKAGKFILTTLHRPTNVDNKKSLEKIASIFNNLSKTLNLVFPIHPRTKKNIKKMNLWNCFKNIKNLKIIEPLNYLDFMKLTKESFCILTDSGGIQEEATYLKIPTLTMRKTTERPATIECGSNFLIGLDKKQILKKIEDFTDFNRKNIKNLPLADGKTSQRIIKIITSQLRS